METTYVFDIETNGLLDTLDCIHSLVLQDVDTGEVTSCAADRNGEEPGGEYSNIQVGLNMLARADMIVGHNIIKFDIPAIQMIHPDWKPKGKVRDTLLLSRLCWPEIKQSDFKRKKAGTLPGQMIGRYSLEAWGHRLGTYKAGTDITDWSTWTPYMQERCVSDVAVNLALWNRIVSKNYAESAVELEHKFQEYIFHLEEHGWPFDEGAASSLYQKLAKRRVEVEKILQETFSPWYRNRGQFTPKRDNKRQGYVAGAALTKIELAPFNPGSRDDIADRLKRLRSWKPTNFTPEGRPQVDETVLSGLPYPEVEPLMEYLLIQKRAAQVAEGPQAWLKKVAPDGRIHGSITTIGAVTRRCTHSHPNVSQVPASKAPYGHECRSCFTVDPGYSLVGADASGLELRCLAHYMAKYDDGAYGRLLVEGDVHWENAVAMGLAEGARDYNDQRSTVLRERGAKTFIYGFLYGAGDEKAGRIIYDVLQLLRAQDLPYMDLQEKFFGTSKVTSKSLKSAGRKLKKSFLAKTPALKRLREDIDDAVDKRGYLKAIDGGRLTVRHKHAALNTLLQSAGAIAVKQATVLACDDLSTSGAFGTTAHLVGHIHDEMQFMVQKGHEDEVGRVVVNAIQRAGDVLGFRCPLDGDYKAGQTWADTH